MGQHFEVARTGYGQLDPVADCFDYDVCWTNGAVPPLLGRFPAAAFGVKIVAALKAGETVVVEDLLRSQVSDEARTRDTATEVDTRAILVVPFVREGRLKTIVYLNDRLPRRWLPEDVAFMEELAERTRLVVEQAAVEEQLRDLNATLEARVEERTAQLLQTEEARREADSLYKAYFDNTPDPLFVVRVEQDEQFIIEQINPAHEENVGLLLRNVKGKSIDEVLPQQAAKKVIDSYRHVVNTREIFHYRELFSLDGSPRHWDTTLVPLMDDHGRVVRLIGSSRDVTRQIVAEEALRQTQKMEAMGQLTGGVAHDFNNLLTPIMGSLDRLQRKGLGDERDQRLIGGALEAADRARVLVQRLLSFARRQPLQPVSVDIGKLVSNMSDLIASTTGPHIKLIKDIPANLPPATADANQVEMALLNLSVNARDAMPDGGTLRISLSSEDISEGSPLNLHPGIYVCLSVEDTGCGMDTQTLGRAVEPFYSTKGIGKGTGLGLSMAHGLAAQLKGTLIVKSELGVGTKVELWLPQSASSALPLCSTTEANDFGPTHGTALLVDDEDHVRASTAEMLIELGYTVRVAVSAEEALRLIEAGLKIDLLVSDHLMPGMSGVELARTLRNRGVADKILIISGYADAMGIDYEVSRLAKPFRQADLAAKIAELG